MTGVQSEHLPLRPSWRCRALGWPCHTRRLQLRAEYTDAMVSLHVYMAGNLVDASRELPSVPAGELYQRFMGWIRQPVDD